MYDIVWFSGARPGERTEAKGQKGSENVRVPMSFRGTQKYPPGLARGTFSTARTDAVVTLAFPILVGNRR